MAPGGCYNADPADIHELFVLHGLLNTAASRDLGLSSVILDRWCVENGDEVDLDLIGDLAFIHARMTEMRGPQHIIGAIQYTRATEDEERG